VRAVGFRYRRSIRVGKGVRLNISKKGIGESVGFKGTRIGVGPRGLIRTYSIPGTSISYIKQTSFKSKGNCSGSIRSSNSDTGNFSSNKDSSGNKAFYFQKQKTNEKKWLILSIISLFFALVNPGFIVFLLLFGLLYYRGLNNPENQSKKLYNKALEFFLNKNFSKALTLLQRSVEYFEDNIFSHFLLAIIYHDQNQFDQAILHIDKYISRKPSDIVAKFAKADCLFESQQYELAIDLLQSFNFYSEEYEIKRILLLGKCYFNLEKYDIAIEQFKKAQIMKRNINEDILECKYWLGVSYYMTGDNKKAKTQLAKVYAENHDFLEVKKYAAKLGLI